ncbi:MAG: hypothetical protein M1469_09435 [Bacteroidetes bacterium]|nr:hypothetical protein [Bacteroidota bacterium]
MQKSLVLLVLSFSLSACTHGLEPISVQPGFSGTVRFISSWPPPDSIYDIRVVAFYHYPPQNIIGDVLSGNARVYPSIGTSAPTFFVDTLSYNFTLDSAAVFQYVVVAMQYGPNLLSDWKVVGAYGFSHGVGSPKAVVVKSNNFVNGIDIDVDFKNTPPTPGGASASTASK